MHSSFHVISWLLNGILGQHTTPNTARFPMKFECLTVKCCECTCCSTILISCETFKIKYKCAFASMWLMHDVKCRPSYTFILFKHIQETRTSAVILVVSYHNTHITLCTRQQAYDSCDEHNTKHLFPGKPNGTHNFIYKHIISPRVRAWASKSVFLDSLCHNTHSQWSGSDIDQVFTKCLHKQYY